MNFFFFGLNINIDWTNKSNFSRRAIATWCLEAHFSQMVNNPTRLISILDYCLVRSNKASNAIKCEVIDSGFSDHKAISLKLDRNPAIYETKKISKWNISKELIQRACLNPVLWNPDDSVDSLASKITDWLSFYQNLALSVKTAKCNPHKKDLFSHDLRCIRDRWKEDSAPLS